MIWPIPAAAFAGLLFGSFINVVAYRVPRGESVIHPASACPACGAEIRRRDNVPVLSWVILRGRCRDCGAAIAVRYPLVEAGTAALFGVLAAAIGAVFVLPAYLWFGGVVLTLTITDIDHKRIPNRILFPGIIAGAALLAAGGALDGDASALLRSAGGSAAYFSFLLLVAVAARGGFGFGDVKLAILLGMFTAYVSWSALAVAVFAAFAFGGVFSVLLLVLGRAGRKDAIPFGPALVAGGLVGILWGDAIGAWYLG